MTEWQVGVTTGQRRAIVMPTNRQHSCKTRTTPASKRPPRYITMFLIHPRRWFCKELPLRPDTMQPPAPLRPCHIGTMGDIWKRTISVDDSCRWRMMRREAMMCWVAETSAGRATSCYVDPCSRKSGGATDSDRKLPSDTSLVYADSTSYH